MFLNKFLENKDVEHLTIISVCISCRLPGDSREPRENRSGFRLYQQLKTMLNSNPLARKIEVRPVECLSLCPRPCGIAISSVKKSSYLFGDQDPVRSVIDILECADLFSRTKDGVMARNERPKTLRSSILGRIPPH